MRNKTFVIMLAVTLLFAGCGKKAGERKAPEFTLTNHDGKQISLADYKGKYVVLEWFNPECPFVKYHYDNKTMDSLAKVWNDDGAIWLAINSTSHAKPEDNKAFAEKYDVRYPLLDDSSGRVGRAYGAKTTPNMFIINKQGKIVYEGAIDNAPMGKTPEGQALVNYVDKALKELHEGKAVSISKTDPYGCSVKYAN